MSFIDTYRTEVVPRLVTAMLYLKLQRKPYAWELRLCEALVLGELVVAKIPSDAGLKQIHDVACEVEHVAVLFGVENGEPAESVEY